MVYPTKKNLNSGTNLESIFLGHYMGKKKYTSHTLEIVKFL